MDKQSKSIRILALIAAADGMRFSDIQRELWEMSHPVGSFTRAQRGYWCTSLLGGMHYHSGLLHTYCEKGADGLWRRNSTPIPNGKPWSGMAPGAFGW